jgi:hypothetical protein
MPSSARPGDRPPQLVLAHLRTAFDLELRRLFVQFLAGLRFAFAHFVGFFAEFGFGLLRKVFQRFLLSRPRLSFFTLRRAAAFCFSVANVFLSSDDFPTRVALHTDTRRSVFCCLATRGPVRNSDPDLEDEMPGPTCPTCDAALPTPKDDPDALEDNVSCPGCGRPLTWFCADRVDGRWIIDEAAEGRIRMSQGPDGVESPAT